MDQELIAHLDRRFDEQKVYLDRRFDEQKAYLDCRFGEHDARFAAIDLRLSANEARLARVEDEIRSTAEETRRHFDVVAEDLRWRIQVVAEGVVALDERLERFRAEVSDQFAAVDRRFLRLEARLYGAGGGEG